MTPKQPYHQIDLDDAQEGWVRVSPSKAGLFVRLKIKGQASKLLTPREAVLLADTLNATALNVHMARPINRPTTKKEHTA